MILFTVLVGSLLVRSLMTTLLHSSPLNSLKGFESSTTFSNLTKKCRRASTYRKALSLLHLKTSSLLKKKNSTKRKKRFLKKLSILLGILGKPRTYVSAKISKMMNPTTLTKTKKWFTTRTGSSHSKTSFLSTLKAYQKNGTRRLR